MAKKDSSPSSKLKKRTPQQEAFEREARDKLENADMKAFDEMMKKLIGVPKEEDVDKSLSSPYKRRR